MSDVFFRELGMPRPDEFLAVGLDMRADRGARGRRAWSCGSARSTSWSPATSTRRSQAHRSGEACVRVAHIEAGLQLRPGDAGGAQPRLTDHRATSLLAHSEEAITNLQREGITSGVHLVGNTIDSLLEHLDSACARRSWEQFGIEAGGYALAFAPPCPGRRQLTLRAVTDGLIALAAGRPVLFRSTRGRCATSRRPVTTCGCARQA